MGPSKRGDMPEETKTHSIVAADAPLEVIREAFKGDRYATESLNAQVDVAEIGHAIVSMKLEPRHRNAIGRVMGGVYFTLGDFSYAVAANVGQPHTVSVSHVIDMIAAAKGDELYAECTLEKSGRRLLFARIVITDGEGRLCARMNITGTRV